MQTRTQHVEAIQAFEFQGMSLGDPEDQLAKHFNDPIYRDDCSNPKAGVATYEVEAPGTDGCYMYFQEGKLYILLLFYGVERVAAMGDWSAILDRLVARFGKPDRDSPGVFPVKEDGEFALYDWAFGEVDRTLRLRVTTEFATVVFTDTNAQLAVHNRKKRQADLGF